MSIGIHQLYRITVTLLVIIGAGALYLLASKLGDPEPDSIIGYSLAFAGTGCMMLAAIRYSQYRRSRNRGIGKLNASLNWHISLAIMAFFLLFMHSFGNFNPRSGTYALYGMIAMVISGFVGRYLDRKLPRLIVQEVAQALTQQGEDPIESISHEVQSIVTYHQQQVRATTLEAAQTGQKKLQMPWDLAYISLEETPQELQRTATQYRFVPDRKSKLARPETLMPGIEANISLLQSIERSHQREQFYRYMIRYWRIVHVSLALLTIGLTIYHVIYALQLLIPVWLHL